MMRRIGLALALVVLFASAAHAGNPATVGVAVSTQSVTVAPLDLQRLGLTLQNIGVADAWCGFTTPATAAGSHLLVSGGGSWVPGERAAWAPVYCISVGSGTTVVYSSEFRR